MGGLFFPALLAVLLASCAGFPATGVRPPSVTAGPAAAAPRRPFTIIDYKNRNPGGSIPGWVSTYYNGGAAGIEASGFFQGRHVFVSRNEGSNFNALAQWTEGFSPDLDFPRLAAARIEARFSSGVPLPDNEYGLYYEALIRAASDALWPGAVKEDDFWIHRQFSPAGEGTAAGLPEGAAPPVTENWEFLILVTIDKAAFASRLEEVFPDMAPGPGFTRAQAAAVAGVRERFSEGF